VPADDFDEAELPDEDGEDDLDDDVDDDVIVFDEDDDRADGTT
jgi:hypothetical protein